MNQVVRGCPKIISVPASGLDPLQVLERDVIERVREVVGKTTSSPASLAN